MKYDQMIERVTHFLKLRNLNMTRERRQIVEAVCDMKRGFSVDDLYFAMHGKGVKTSKATLYRTVQLMVEARVLKESELSGRQAAYEILEPGEHHGVMVCQHCNRTFEFRGPSLDRFLHEASVNHQFLPLSSSIKLTGVCGECVKSNPPSLRKEVCVPFLKYDQSRRG